jgi:hypothetical protein
LHFAELLESLLSADIINELQAKNLMFATSRAIATALETAREQRAANVAKHLEETQGVAPRFAKKR